MVVMFEALRFLSCGGILFLQHLEVPGLKVFPLALSLAIRRQSTIHNFRTSPTAVHQSRMRKKDVTKQSSVLCE